MTDLAIVMRGRVWKVGHSVDTDQLSGSGSIHAVTDESLRKNCLLGIYPRFTAEVQAGDILVAGLNFGCGSSRQTAVQALQLCGVSVVLAESVARIHGRNSVALGLPTFALAGITALAEEGDELEVDYPGRTVRNLTRGGELAIPDLPGSVEDIYRAGGLMQVILSRLKATGIEPSPASI